ncbi:MAG: 30S ribosomal protein S6 [Oscillospiraceae bacterium]|jgi:small subunit ribosomal protein S6|nr:30S ribosomal protein S6 [Oscillospiraceae bacterium]MBQ6849963.1 30S ribosomal protein S6 [Oscillospiraceae bacterium]MBR5805693.1 30S ribosomal protein S6 [Oscillospiraceae bacterium]MBR5874192.1 30S ribosomal protein S6 [Oscillospiraceae bacterium]MBR6609809.1 30S ribosomal protein S6 [Oscillospiraceae bacterium]
MQKYESMVVISTKQDEEAIKGLVEKFSSLISANGTLVSVDEWGKRKLAYMINKETEGYYVLFTFECEAAFPAELGRVFKITEGLLRTMIIAL